MKVELEIKDVEGLRALIREVIDEALGEFNPIRVDQPDDFLTKEDVGDMLQMSKSGIDNMRRRGLLKPIRIGGAVRFKRSEILDMLDQTNGRKTKINNYKN